MLKNGLSIHLGLKVEGVRKKKYCFPEGHNKILILKYSTFNVTVSFPYAFEEDR